jgi:hypothetical protein
MWMSCKLDAGSSNSYSFTGPNVHSTSIYLEKHCNSEIFQLYHGENMFIFNEMMRSVLYNTNKLSWIFIVLAHWNNRLRIDMSPHSDTIAWFQANQSLFCLLNAACLAGEATNTNIIVFGLTRIGLNPMIYHTWGEHAKHYTTDVIKLYETSVDRKDSWK